jgi:hypothetical protein
MQDIMYLKNNIGKLIQSVVSLGLLTGLLPLSLYIMRIIK